MPLGDSPVEGASHRLLHWLCEGIPEANPSEEAQAVLLDTILIRH